jgi:fatty acyl-CoA reductase
MVTEVPAAASRSDTGRGRTFVLTGVTGFLGKVVLEELLRRREELHVDHVHVLIRPRGSRTAEERFQREVATSDCFSELPPDWTDSVTVVRALLESPSLDLDESALARLTSETTHVVHAAASVEFNLPLKSAARSNVTTTLNLLELARTFGRLERLVYVSTAYSTPNPGPDVPIEPVLAPLRAPAEELLQDILQGNLDERELLALTGHPNTYTLTKCLAEHLLATRREEIPLTIVRPSVISASWRYPFPGWIDSVAAFAAFVVLIGAGHMRALIAELDARLDLYPVDEVAARILEACDDTAAGDGDFAIRHAVAGLARSPTMRECWETICEFFSTHRVDRRPALRYAGPPGLRFALADVMHHRLPVGAASLRSRRARRSGSQVLTRISHLNTVFPYFTRQSFAFRPTRAIDDAYDVRGYVETVCRGVYRHVLARDDSQWLLDGRRHKGHGGDARWVSSQPEGNGAIRISAWLMTKLARRCFERVTVDLPSFEAAVRAIPEGAKPVILPSHRSYFDFVLCSYLFFARPDLGIPIPHIAAATEFGRIPLLGRILNWLHAFYVARGPRRENKELSQRVAALIQSGKTLEFFIEGARSRSREFLPPKRGLLRCLQDTGQTFALLPVAISYDRVPEEATFARELAGSPKPEMRLGALLRWSADAFRGRIDLGRVHLACGTPVYLAPGTSVQAASREVIERLREVMATTTYHIRGFLRGHPIEGADAEWLRTAIEERGARVLDSALEPPEFVDPLIAGTLARHFDHYFADEKPYDELTRRLVAALFPGLERETLPPERVEDRVS